VSDDGLQHYRLPRAAEIIMLDGARGLGNGWRLPAGPLRESPARLQEADFIICKAAGTGMRSMPTGTLGMQLRMEEAVQLVNGVRMPMQAFSGKHVHAVAGIGHPEQFFTALEAMGLMVDGRPLPDHAKFTEADLRFEGDEAVLMTEKDAVKCHAMHLPRHWYVSATAHFADADANRILGYLRKRLGEHGVQPEAVR
ncbi:MAG: tetraacyldisaccharide 4'-kinase, partial [Gammaproteobacteria bacterium]|nr:tetraacyldisaccharide 4'-kinase [Gammaproteobacteria bacterium]